MLKQLSPTTTFTSAFEEFQKSMEKKVKVLIQLNKAATTGDHKVKRVKKPNTNPTTASPIQHHLPVNTLIETQPHGKNPPYSITIYSLQNHKMVIYSVQEVCINHRSCCIELTK